MISILDYGLGNVNAFANVYRSLGVPYQLVSEPQRFSGTNKIILPGVGSFDHAMTRLNGSGLRESLDELALQRRVPILGVCVGMQMLADSSEEGSMPGLGWIPGVVRKLDHQGGCGNLPLPHMGWNTLDTRRLHPLLEGQDPSAGFYFLHSYYFDCPDPDGVLATVSYGFDFPALIVKDNIFGIQCHPEKSHGNGVQLLRQFAEL